MEMGLIGRIFWGGGFLKGGGWGGGGPPAPAGLRQGKYFPQNVGADAYIGPLSQIWRFFHCPARWIL